MGKVFVHLVKNPGHLPRSFFVGSQHQVPVAILKGSFVGLLLGISLQFFAYIGFYKDKKFAGNLIQNTFTIEGFWLAKLYEERI